MQWAVITLQYCSILRIIQAQYCCTYQDIVRFNILMYNYGVMSVHIMHRLRYFHHYSKCLIHRELCLE